MPDASVPTSEEEASSAVSLGELSAVSAPDSLAEPVSTLALSSPIESLAVDVSATPLSTTVSPLGSVVDEPQPTRQAIRTALACRKQEFIPFDYRATAARARDRRYLLRVRSAIT